MPLSQKGIITVLSLLTPPHRCMHQQQGNKLKCSMHVKLHACAAMHNLSQSHSPPRPHLLSHPTHMRVLLPFYARPFSFLRSMAWTCSASSHAALIDNLVSTRIVTQPTAEAALRAVDRRFFVLPPHPPYVDSPQPLLCSATISAPHMHALALEKLASYLKPGAHALDVGAGSGYLAACMAHMVGPQGLVVGVEHAPTLVHLAKENLNKLGELGKRVVLEQGDGRLGWQQFAPYDAIHVGAAAETVPQELMRQLKPGGAMIIPVGPEHAAQTLLMIINEGGEGKRQAVCGVRYVPLCDLNHQLG